ncbi:MAG: hypothetical protein P0S96_06605 [Simkaniaceae bacterium]|nr:hypothetical protein [Candidatus Sacchlamyda saccharinae]
MKNKYWLFSGSTSLLLSFYLLLWHAGPLLAKPVWITGLVLTSLVACFILYLTFRELLSRENSLLLKIDQLQEKSKSLQVSFEEARTLYREKVERLEETISATEKILSELQKNFSINEEQTKAQKNHTQSFQISLEDALDQLREAQAIQYFQQEIGKTLPKDLPSQHRQLREQFEEKSLILEQTRRRLFQIEGQLLSIKKEDPFEKPEEEHLMEMVEKILEENHYLEQEILQLEQLLSLKPKREKKHEKKPEPVLELFP